MQRHQSVSLSRIQLNSLDTRFVVEGLTLTEAKLKAIRDWATPQNVTDVRSFLGFTNYYRRYIRNYSDIAGPLTDLTKKEMVWQWGPYQKNAFAAMKEAFCRAPILIIPRS